jgi:hypothetical protein
MKIGILAGAAMAGLLGASAANAAVFKDYVSVLVPGNQLVTFETFGESSEAFLGLTGLPLSFISGSIVLTEPGTGVVSDILTIVPTTTGGVDIIFTSDTDAGVPLPTAPAPVLATLQETGAIQDVSKYFTSTPGNITVLVGSDLDTTVPEPATWAMMLVGIGMAGGIMRARGKAATSPV